MPKIADEVSTNRRSTANARVELEDDTYPGRIQKFLFYWENAAGQKVDGGDGASKKVGVYVRLDPPMCNLETGEPIVLSRKFGAVLFKSDGSPTLFAKALQAITGIAAGDKLQGEINTDDYVEKPVRVTTSYNAEKGYTNIEAFLRASREVRGETTTVRGASATRPQAAAPPAQRQQPQRDNSTHGRGERRPSAAEIFG